MVSEVTFEQIDRVARLLAELDGINRLTWVTMDEEGRTHYRLKAEKVIKAVTND